MFINAELSQLPVSDGREAARRIVNLAAALREAGAVTGPVLVVDLSVNGFRADTEHELVPGSEVWLKLPGCEARRSRVIWAEGKKAGCEFENPFHETELAAIAAPERRVRAKDVFRRR